MAGRQIKEKSFYSVSPKLLVANGNTFGLVKLASARDFKVKQIISIQNAGSDGTNLEIKEIRYGTDIYIGPIGGSIESRTDTSSFTTALGAFIFSEKQNRPKVPEQEVNRAAFEEDPTNAYRSMLVDQDGCPLDASNPLPIEGSITIGGLASPIIANLSAPTVQEYSYTFPSNTKKFIIKARNYSPLRVAWSLGETSSNYLSYAAGNTLTEDNLKLISSLTVYIYPTHANTTLEIQYWT
jgi:hypothetical protein